jgi:hypothetical protein
MFVVSTVFSTNPIPRSNTEGTVARGRAHNTITIHTDVITASTPTCPHGIIGHAR